jgi:parvulin-like peptidyl-prolyl isomerase
VLHFANPVQIARIWLCCIAVAAALLLTPAFVRAGDKAPAVLVVVNGDSITSADLDKLLIETHQSMGRMQRQDFDYHKLLDRLVNDRLLIQEAVTLGMNEEPQLLAMLDKRRDRQAVSRWVKDHYHPDVKVDDGAVWEYYRANYARRQLRVIVVQTEEEAKAVRNALRDGAGMDSLAREKSIDSYKATGGLRKMTFYYDLEPVLRSQTDGMEAGGVSEPFAYRSVFAVVRLEQDTPADSTEFDSARPAIESWLNKQGATRQWDVFVASLREQFEMSVDTTALAAIEADSMALYSPGFSEGTGRVLMRTGAGVQVTDSEFRKEMGHLAMSSAGSLFHDLYRNTLSKFNEMLVLVSAANRDGYDKLPEVLDTYDRSLDSALVEIYIKETVLSRLTFRHDEFETYYQEHLDDFKTPDECQFDRMTIDSAQTAMEIYRLLLEGADFRYVSRQYDTRVTSIDESGEWLDLSRLPDAIRQEITGLRIGECTSPHQTGEGWLILRLKARRAGQTAPLDQVEPKIREAMFQRKFDEELNGVLSMLKEHADIRYDEKAIQEYFGDDS